MAASCHGHAQPVSPGRSLPELLTGHRLTGDAPGAFDRVDDVDPDVLLRLAAARHFMNDLGGFGDISHLDLSVGEGDWGQFQAAAITGLLELREAVEALRTREGDRWLAKFADFYMSTKRTCNLKESCALQSLTPEVARAGDATKSAYETEMLCVVEAIAGGLDHGVLSVRRKTAWAIMAMLSGGVTLARATRDPAVGAQIANSVKATVMAAAELTWER